MSEDEPHDRPRTLHVIRELVLTVGFALALAWLVQGFLVKPYRIPSASMENTIHCQDRILADRVSYRFGAPHRGDVVVFHPPAAIVGGVVNPARVANVREQPEGAAAGARRQVRADKTYIKRLIGKPGDRVEVRQHHAVVNGKRLKERYLPRMRAADRFDSAGDFGPITVPKGSYLMLGDNREHSYDGRFFGFVPRSFIVGKAIMVYWPPSRFGGLPSHNAGGAAARALDPSCEDG